MVSVLQDTQNPTGQAAEQPDLTESALSRGPERGHANTSTSENNSAVSELKGS